MFTLQTLPACNPEDQIGDTVDRETYFNLHVGITTRSHERQKLERICRYISRQKRWFTYFELSRTLKTRGLVLRCLAFSR